MFRMSAKEFKNQKNKVHSTRKSSSICKNNSETKIRLPKIQKVQGVRRNSCSTLFEGSFIIEVKINGKTRADIDNILKGVLDSLNGIAYKDDRQCVDARVYRSRD